MGDEEGAVNYAFMTCTCSSITNCWSMLRTWHNQEITDV